jgi:hypothetical protein
MVYGVGLTGLGLAGLGLTGLWFRVHGLGLRVWVSGWTPFLTPARRQSGSARGYRRGGGTSTALCCRVYDLVLRV